jgi:hypothetical protein
LTPTPNTPDYVVELRAEDTPRGRFYAVNLDGRRRYASKKRDQTFRAATGEKVMLERMHRTVRLIDRIDEDEATLAWVAARKESWARSPCWPEREQEERRQS